MYYNIFSMDPKTSSKSTATTNNAYLELIIGPMFSGKTSKLLEIYKQCKFCNIPVSVINHAEDIRYHEEMLSTHDKVMIPCIQTAKLMDVWPSYDLPVDSTDFTLDRNMEKFIIETSDVILINEGQFFDDLYICVEKMLLSGKKVYVCGLDGDFKRAKFGQILDLIPLCDKVTKLTSLCSQCKNGTHGIFSMRLTDEMDQTLIGSDNYIPVCRNCYNNNNKY